MHATASPPPAEISFTLEVGAYVHLMNEIAAAFVLSQPCEPSVTVRLKVTGFRGRSEARNLSVSASELMAQLGSVVKRDFHGMSVDINFPGPSDVATILFMIREEFCRLYSSGRHQDLVREFRGAPRVTWSTDKAIAIALMAIDLLLVGIASKHSDERLSELGVVDGLVAEFWTLSHLAPEETWSTHARRLVASVFKGAEFLLTQSPIVLCDPARALGGRENPTPFRAPRTRWHDVQRLLFYLKQPGYVGMRTLSGENPNDYVGLCFKLGAWKVVVLDTAVTQNRLFVLVAPDGNFSSCMAIAGGRKSEIAASWFCQPVIHGEGWQNRLATKLREIRESAPA